MSDYAVRNYPLSIDQGDSETFEFYFKNSTGTPIDLTGYTATMDIFWNHGRYPGNGYLLANGGIVTLTGVITVLTGKIVFTLSSALSATIPASGVDNAIQNTQYKVKLISGSVVETLIAGPLKVYVKGF